MRTIAITLLLTSVVGLSGCGASRGLRHDTELGSFTLVRMELDRATLKNRGYLPMFDRPTGASGAGIPRAQGQMQINEFGKVTVDVRAYEPMVGLGGRIQATQVDLIRFYGRVTADGELFVMEDPPATAPLGTATRIHVETTKEGYIRLQAATGKLKLPYLYYFKPGARPPEPINVPYYEG